MITHAASRKQYTVLLDRPEGCSFLYFCAYCVEEESSAVGAAREKGDILSRERISPLDPQENARGLAP